MPASAARAALRPARLPLWRNQTPNLRIRQPHNVTKRHASNTAEASEKAKEATEKAKETASNFQSKASEGLSRVKSSAGESLGKVTETASNVASGANSRISRTLSYVTSFIPGTVYYSKVAWETAKIVFHTEKMYPPSGAQISSYYQSLVKGVRNPSSLVSQNPGLLNPQQLLNRARNMTNKEMVYAGIIFAQVLGFFTVGEMIGKLKLVGYRGKVEHEH